MDEIKRAGAGNKPLYGEEQRNAFLQWFEGYIEKAKTARDAAEASPNRSEKVVGVLNEYCDFLDKQIKEQREDEFLFLNDIQQTCKGKLLTMSLFFKNFKNRHQQEILEDPQWSNDLWQELGQKIDDEIARINEAAEMSREMQTDEQSIGTKQDDDLLSLDDEPIPSGKKDEGLDDSLSDGEDLDPESDAILDGKLNSPVWELMENDEKADRIQKHRESIRNTARILWDSRTLVNSKEYCALVDMMKKVGDGKTDGMRGKDERERFAQELYTIHGLTEKYLEHKARDGVKKNSYRKLLAVEKTNQLLARCIADLGDVEVDTGRLIDPDGSSEMIPETMNLSDLKVTLEQRQERFLDPMKATSGMREARSLLRNKPELAGVDEKLIAACVRSVDACMCEIILKAEENNDPTAMRSLQAMRKSFLDDPFPAAKEASAPAVENKTIGKNKAL